MRAVDLFEEPIKKSRRFINPPYTIKEICILVGTLIILLAIPVTIISVNQARELKSQADSPPTTIGSAWRKSPSQTQKITLQSSTTQASSQQVNVPTDVKTLFDLVNNYRVANGRSALKGSVILTNVANWMANDMASNNYFSHTDSLGRDPHQRMDDFGYTFNTWKAENLVAGIPDAQTVFDAWKGSPGHNENLLNPNFTVMGLARAYAPGSTSGWYWAQEFGGVLDSEAIYNPACDYACSIEGMVVTPSGNGYWSIASDGRIFTFGDAGFYGSTGGTPLNKPIVGMAVTPSGNGYWLVASDGGIFTYGDAGFHGSAGNTPLNKPIVGMAATPTGNGYWLVASDGGIFTYGDAGFHGSAGNIPLTHPIVGMTATPTGNGYWLVASDGGIFTYGDAGFHGSAGNIPLNQPIVGMAATPTGNGYWLVASDGGIFSYGDVGFYGSAGGISLAQPIVGMAATPTGNGYWLVASDGGIFAFGDVDFYGSARRSSDTCTSWSNALCGGERCASTRMYQTRDCTYNCASEGRCIESTACAVPSVPQNLNSSVPFCTNGSDYQANLSWTLPSGTTRVEFQMRDLSTGQLASTHSWSYGKTNITVFPKKWNVYEWKVRAGNNYKWSNWNSQTFRVPACTSDLAIKNGNVNLYNSRGQKTTNFKPGETVTAKFNIQNVGWASASNFYVELWADAIGSGVSSISSDSCDYPQSSASAFFSSTILPGQSIPYSIRFAAPIEYLDFWPYYVWVVVDSSCDITEATENSNMGMGSYYVSGPISNDDMDGDGYTNWKELYLGTDPTRSCPRTSTPNDELIDAWPPDFDDNRVINISDVGELLPPRFGTSVPPTSPRYDLVPNGFINILDLGAILSPTFGTSCK